MKLKLKRISLKFTPECYLLHLYLSRKGVVHMPQISIISILLLIFQRIMVVKA